MTISAPPVDAVDVEDADAYVGTCDLSDCDMPTAAIVWTDHNGGQWLSGCREHAAAELVRDLAPRDVYVEDDAEYEPTVWLHNHAEPDRPMALLTPGILGRRGRQLLWDHIVRGLPASAPVPR